ncbi:MAG TPA: HDOD domain-containing protein [Syntrophorhabdaceae bacterium]|nr:HDOD domain-containing protein [Syntrophorhabdaceae bacterium]
MTGINKQKLRFQVENTHNLPTIPATLKNILNFLENPSVSINKISDFISKDPVLAMKVLKMINSPVYGFPGRISSVNQAVLLLGLNVIKGMLLGVSVFELMQKAMVGLWEHSIGCAALSSMMAKKKGLKSPEDITIAGLLHDIGKVLLAVNIPEVYERLIAATEKNGLTILEEENTELATNHAEVGSWIASKWNFPKNLIEIIQYHHEPYKARIARTECAIVHISDIIVRARGFGFAGDNLIPEANQEAWDILGFSDDDIRELLIGMEDSLEDYEDLGA